MSSIILLSQKSDGALATAAYFSATGVKNLLFIETDFHRYSEIKDRTLTLMVGTEMTYLVRLPTLHLTELTPAMVEDRSWSLAWFFGNLPEHHLKLFNDHLSDQCVIFADRPQQGLKHCEAFLTPLDGNVPEMQAKRSPRLIWPKDPSFKIERTDGLPATTKPSERLSKTLNGIESLGVQIKRPARKKSAQKYRSWMQELENY